jgi:alkylation response protein AidB-like acyl-CoA dehydrogenase
MKRLKPLWTVKRFVDAECGRARPRFREPGPRRGLLGKSSEAHEVGIRTMTLSEKWGGLATDSLTTAMVIEELAKGDIGVSVIFAQTLKIAQIMEKALNAEQRERVLPGFAGDPRGMLAIGITEPDNASNYFLPFPTPFRTSAASE